MTDYSGTFWKISYRHSNEARRVYPARCLRVLSSEGHADTCYQNRQEPENSARFTLTNTMISIHDIQTKEDVYCLHICPYRDMEKTVNEFLWAKYSFRCRFCCTISQSDLFMLSTREQCPNGSQHVKCRMGDHLKHCWRMNPLCLRIDSKTPRKTNKDKIRNKKA